MKGKNAVWLFVLLLIFPIACIAESDFGEAEAIARAAEEWERDGVAAQGVLQNESLYQTFVHCWPEPEAESVRGETWYIHFRALNANMDSYIVGLNEDGELRFLDCTPGEEARRSLEIVRFGDLLDRYQEKYGMMDSWNHAVMMSFAAEVSKGRPDSRNAWRFQHAVFLPVPTDAISRDEARLLAAEAIGFPIETAITCTCLWDEGRMIFKVAFSHGSGWEYMVEMDCVTGEILKTIPFRHWQSGWTDCYVPQSVVDRIPPIESFDLSNG